jgi:hypothetical protein
MSVAFHRGLTHELILRVQMAGLRIDEIDAQRALAGMPLVDSDAGTWLDTIVADILSDDKRHGLMRDWEDSHPGKNPFPPAFAEVVIHMIENLDPDGALDALKEILELARQELLFG